MFEKSYSAIINNMKESGVVEHFKEFRKANCTSAIFSALTGKGVNDSELLELTGKETIADIRVLAVLICEELERKGYVQTHMESIEKDERPKKFLQRVAKNKVTIKGNRTSLVKSWKFVGAIAVTEEGQHVIGVTSINRSSGRTKAKVIDTFPRGRDKLAVRKVPLKTIERKISSFSTENDSRLAEAPLMVAIFKWDYSRFMNVTHGYFAHSVFSRLRECRSVMKDLVGKQRVYVREVSRLREEDKRNQWADFGYRSKAEFKRVKRMKININPPD